MLLKEIEDYNRYDCRSTRKLRDWLLARAFESGVAPMGPQSVRDGGQIEVDDALERALTAFVGDERAARTPEQTAVAMIGAARGFHQRENKPYWWAHFDRLNNPVDEWGGQADVFVADDARGHRGLAHPRRHPCEEATPLGAVDRRIRHGRAHAETRSRCTTRPLRRG